MMWKPPYSYREGSAIVAGLLAVGLMLQASVGPLDWDIFASPANIVVLVVFVWLLVVAYALRRRVYFFQFMATGKAAVPAIVAACLLTIIMGLTRQVDSARQPYDHIGLSKMLSFWPFVLVYVWMTAIVGEVAIGQMRNLICEVSNGNHKSQASNLKPQSLLSHIGLFIVLTCGTLGSADMQRLKMYCEQGKPEWRGLDAYNTVHELPLAIELEKFTIDEYPPKLMVIDAQGRPLPLGKPQTLSIDTAFKGGELQGWTVNVARRIDNALPDTAPRPASAPTQYAASKKPGSACALFVHARDGCVVREGWVSSGSYLFPWKGLDLAHGCQLVMPPREPKRFSSVIDVYTKDGKSLRAEIEVNHPFTVNGWKIYQYSYNQQMGKWSTLSVFELVRDPWLPVVYLGILLLALGAIGMLFGKPRKHGNHKSQISNLNSQNKP